MLSANEVTYEITFFYFQRSFQENRFCFCSHLPWEVAQDVQIALNTQNIFQRRRVEHAIILSIPTETLGTYQFCIEMLLMSIANQAISPIQLITIIPPQQ